ncbi:MAG TPA: transcriptional regulator, partial [Ilumatobacteraceae bacterium]
QRQDFNGRVLTIRADDQRAIAAMLDIPVDQVAARLEALDLVFRAG